MNFYDCFMIFGSPKVINLFINLSEKKIIKKKDKKIINKIIKKS